MKVVIVGTGYVGLVTGACLADVGLNVCCVDVDVKKIENLKKGILPIYEPGLDVIVERNFKKERLTFSTDLPSAMKGSEVAFIAVGTPPAEWDVALLHQAVLAVATETGERMSDYGLVDHQEYRSL